MSYVFNPFTGNFDKVGSSGGSSSPDNFSYKEIPVGESVTIPEGQQMLYAGDVRILGDLYCLGDMREVGGNNTDAFGLGKVPVGEVVVVPENKILFYRNLNIQGDLRVLGDIIEV